MYLEFDLNRLKEEGEAYAKWYKKEYKILSRVMLLHGKPPQKVDPEVIQRQAFEELKKIKIVSGTEELDPKQ